MNGDRRNKKAGSLRTSAKMQSPAPDNIMNQIADGIITVDSNWRCTYMNDAALAIHPSGREGTLGKLIWEVHPGLKGTIFWEKFQQAMATRQVAEVESYFEPLKAWFYVKLYPTDQGLTILFMDFTLRKRAEMEAMKMQTIDDGIPEAFDAMWSINLTYDLIFFNTAFHNFIKKLTGREIQIGDNIQELIPGNSGEWTVALDRALQGHAFAGEFKKTIDGQERIQQWHIRPVRTEEGQVSGASVFVHDITERKNTQREFEESGIRYTTVINQMSDAMFIVGPDGNYIDVNPSACKLLGYSREELLAIKPKDVLFDEERARNIPQRLESLRRGESGAMESVLKRKDGSPVDVEINSQMLSNGYFVGIARDITERKRIQNILNRSEKRFRSMIENSHDIIALLDRDFQTVYRSASAAKVTGSERSDPNSVHPEDSGVMEHVINETLRSPGLPIPISFRAKHREGHYIWLEGTFTNLFVDPDVNAIVVNLKDVTERKLAQEKLIENERRFRALIENISDGIVVNDAGYNLLYQSSSVTRILGYTWEDRQGSAVTDYIHPDNKRDFDELFRKLKQNPGISLPFESRFRHKDGRYLWLEGVITNLTHEPGVNAYVANYRDVTERKASERELSRERTLLRTVIDNLPDYIYAKDNDHKYLVNNKAHLFQMGLMRQEDAIGKTSAQIFGGEKVRAHQIEDDQVFTTGRAVLDREELVLNDDGLPKFLLTSKVPIYDINKHVTGLVAISRDITKQKQIELDLRNSNYFLARAQKAGKIGYWISYLDGSEKLIWSPETSEIFGFDVHTFNQNIDTFYGIIHPDDKESVKQAAKFAIENIEPYSIDHRILLPDGTVKWVHEQGEVTFNDGGRRFQLLGIVQDITERKNAEHEILDLNYELEERVQRRTVELEVANKEMESFTYSVSHDLRSPLRIIDGYAQILVEDYSNMIEGPGAKALGVIMESAKKMGKLIDDLLDFSRIGRKELRKSMVNMDDLCHEVLEELRMGGTVIPTDIQINPLEYGNCDPSLIKNVWTNLLSNAIKYSGNVPQPRIEVGMTTRDAIPAYYVRDNGVGFDMQYYHKLFGVFQRLHSHYEFSGTGVGLAIVHRIVSRHGGAVWATSEPGKGSTFFFSL